jgi:hypothetical protein
VHAHGCARCGVRYEDACDARAVDGLCVGCRGGRPWQLLIDGRRPRKCCITGSRPATKDERKRYRLAGACAWFICVGDGGCRRTHPFDPAKTKEGVTA